MEDKMAFIADVVFQTVRNYGDKSLFCKF